MALSDYGQSFSPLRQGPDAGRAKPGGGSQTQEAIRTISTRIPRITQGGQSLAPAPLLNAPGGMGMAAPMGTAGAPSLGLEELIRRLFGLLGGGAPMGGPAPMGAPGGMAPMAGAPLGAPLAPPTVRPGGMGSAPPPRVVPGSQGPFPGPIQPAPVDPSGSWFNTNPYYQGGIGQGRPPGPIQEQDG